MKIYILTHTDLDGFFSGAITRLELEKLFPGAEITAKKWTYGNKLVTAKHLIKNYDRVYICDLMPDVEFMKELAMCSKPEFLTWIDHHVAPDTELTSACEVQIAGLRTLHKKSAAALCWEYFRKTDTVPDWLQLLSDYDSWNKPEDKAYWADKVMPYFHYLTVNVTDIDSAYHAVKNIYDMERKGCKYDPVPDIETGCVYKEAIDAEYLKEALHGYKRDLICLMQGEVTTLHAYILNTQLRGSSIFQDLPAKNDYDVFIVFNYNGTKYQYSMYTFKEGIYCNETTLMFTDGSELRFRGHRDAAGANSDFFPLL